MQVITLVSAVFGARCSVLVDDDGSCVVIDAGAGVMQEVLSLVRARGLRPAAVLATHGHVDHTWDAGPLSAALDVPVLLHAADAYRLADPFGTLGLLGSSGSPTHDPSGPLAQALVATGVDPARYAAPDRVEPFGGVDDVRSADSVLELGGLRIVARHAPGHTEGSTLYLVEDLAFTGDVLFAGSVGRTDLPGGDQATMQRTLREVVATLPPGTVVVPGHGPTSEISSELAHNPYLQRL
ncbi:MBL fold metallo-hydrolase [Cellulomonas fengjieae]|uniref:MBL fold metallo-hydrolase n=1 Tax=Cellulomonas fengjieae TaxID=2819978 RepID=A0ABS3SID7_9CELL|nr:MBL fold metallo-hydrolase [Cellulomonas fengjieae]MBO3085508.1 MBL fold metallo-hydrolase [Cellulomonas fengjieae]MBO3102616.1 MBL fold metallo-hydrolase [Cellulomonas fengjieae]QVI64448.1 MBL fold metallo-hydrolase [Cellulomonas fengjieae]